VADRRLAVETLLVESLVGVVPVDAELPPPPVPLVHLAELGLVMPPVANPLRREVEAAAEAQGVALDVHIEVEGIRLIGDLVASGSGASILPETAIPTELPGLRVVEVAGLPPRRLGLVYARDAYLSLADRAVRDSLLELVTRDRPPSVLSPPHPGH
jgi:DNA-binding transcriptional LysR family regulator